MELAAIIIAGLSLILAIVSFIFSINAQAKAGLLARENTNLSNGMIELEVRTAIREESARVNEIGIRLNSLIAKKKSNSFSEEQSFELEGFKRLFF